MQSHKLISAGREDVDVRMLGKGRPFIMELADPKVAAPATVDLAAVEAALLADQDRFSGVQARSLQVVGQDRLEQLKAGEEDKEKRYLATVKLDRPVVSAQAADLCCSMTSASVETA